MPHSEKLLQRETLGKNRVFTHERWQVRLETAGLPSVRSFGTPVGSALWRWMKTAGC